MLALIVIGICYRIFVGVMFILTKIDRFIDSRRNRVYNYN